MFTQTASSNHYLQITYNKFYFSHSEEDIVMPVENKIVMMVFREEN